MSPAFGFEILRSGAAAVFTLGQALKRARGICFQNRVVRFEEFFQSANEFSVFRLDAEVGPLLTLLALEQTGLADDLDVAGNRGLRHFQDVREFANAERILPHETDDAPAGGIREGAGECYDIFRHGNNRDGKSRYDKDDFTNRPALKAVA